LRAWDNLSRCSACYEHRHLLCLSNSETVETIREFRLNDFIPVIFAFNFKKFVRVHTNVVKIFHINVVTAVNKSYNYAEIRHKPFILFKYSCKLSRLRKCFFKNYFPLLCFRNLILINRIDCQFFSLESRRKRSIYELFRLTNSILSALKYMLY
jgi:hypothetical protein